MVTTIDTKKAVLSQPHLDPAVVHGDDFRNIGDRHKSTEALNLNDGRLS